MIKANNKSVKNINNLCFFSCRDKEIIAKYLKSVEAALKEVIIL